MDQQFFDDARNRHIQIDAKPQPVIIDAARTAVIVVDMQNDFGSPNGMFARAGIDIAPIQAVVEPIAQVLRAGRQAGLKVVYLKMGFRADLSDTGGPDAPNWFKVHEPVGVGQTVTLPDGNTSRIWELVTRD